MSYNHKNIKILTEKLSCMDNTIPFQRVQKIELHEVEKYIDKDCYFIDFENTHQRACTYLKNVTNSMIFFFTSSKLVINTTEIDSSNIIKVFYHNSRNRNYADFLLDFKLLEVIQEKRYRSVQILSNDIGFGGMIKIAKEFFNQPCHQIKL